MMPLELEISGGAANALVCNGTNNISVHVEPSASTSNVSPCSDDQIPEQNHATTVRFSVLRESLRPITLKVRSIPLLFLIITSKKLNYREETSILI